MASLTLYPLIQQQVNYKTADDFIAQLRANQQQASEPIYYIYSHFQADFEGSYKLSIATETPHTDEYKRIVIDDLAFYEKFITDSEHLQETWQSIGRKTQQGLLKRDYGIDFEKHFPDGRVEIYIQITPHC